MFFVLRRAVLGQAVAEGVVARGAVAG